MKEIFKPITGFNNYQISNFGNVISMARKWRKKTSYLKPHVIKNGYLRVNLKCQITKKLKHFLVHRLVAQQFLENPNNYKIINHKDSIKTNNNVSNLEWCSQKHNIQHSLKNKTFGSAKIYFEIANKIRKDYKTGKFSQKEIAVIYKTSQDQVSRIINNKIWKL